MVFSLDKICIWSLFRLRLTSYGLVISMINSRLCCIQVQDPAIHVYRLCFYVRYIYSQSASYQPALFIRLRELAGKPDKVLGVNLNWATNYSWPSFFMGHKKEFIDFTALSFSDILQFVRSIILLLLEIDSSSTAEWGLFGVHSVPTKLYQMYMLFHVLS